MKIIKCILKELKEVGLVTIFFLISFSLILVLFKLFLADYSIEVYVFGKIIIGSLFAAKAVIIIDKLKIVKKMENKPRYIPVIYKTFFYTITVLFLGFLEKIFRNYKETKGIGSAIMMIFEDRNLTQFFAVILCLAIVFSIYNIIDEIELYLGKGELRRLFFNRPVNK